MWRDSAEEVGEQHGLYRDLGLFAFAGLWDAWAAPDGSELESCTIITVAPNALMEGIHNRMPAIVAQEQEAVWLATSVPVAQALGVLRSAPEQELEAYPVSTMVNRPGMDRAECIVPLSAEE